MTASSARTKTWSDLGTWSRLIWSTALTVASRTVTATSSTRLNGAAAASLDLLPLCTTATTSTTSASVSTVAPVSHRRGTSSSLFSTHHHKAKWMPLSTLLGRVQCAGQLCQSGGGSSRLNSNTHTLQHHNTYSSTDCSQANVVRSTGPTGPSSLQRGRVVVR